MNALSQRMYFRRRFKNAVALSLSLIATATGLFFLVWILWITFSNGVAALKLTLFTQMTPPPGADGGLLNAFAGSLMMLLLAVVIGTPIGIAAGTYLAEYARKSVISFYPHHRSCSACSSTRWWCVRWGISPASPVASRSR